MCSFDQLLLEHRVNPEEVLANLGFVRRSTSEVRRIPDHFLLYQSHALGISAEDYLTEYPEVRQHLEQKLAVENAYRIVNRMPPSPLPPSADDRNGGQSTATLRHLRGCPVDFEGELKDRFCRVEDHLRCEGRNLQDDWDSLLLPADYHCGGQSTEKLRTIKDCSVDVKGRLKDKCHSFGGYFEGCSKGKFQNLQDHSDNLLVSDPFEGWLTDSVGKLKEKSQRVSCGDYEGQFKEKSCSLRGHFECHLKDKVRNSQSHSDKLSLEMIDEAVNSDESLGSEVHSQGHSAGFQGHPPSFQGHSGRVNPLSVAMLTVSSLFADDRLPLRYLESLMRRLRSGRDSDQAALVFDGYGLGWSWKLDSESLSSVWLPSTDLDWISFLGESVATDDWSMQPPTADPPTAADWSLPLSASRDWLVQPPVSGDWSVAPPTAADWQLPSARDWSMQPHVFYSEHTLNSTGFPPSCSMLPAIQRPISGLLSTTSDCFPDQFRNPTDSHSPDSPDQTRSPEAEHKLGDLERPGGIFCECCSRLLKHQLSPATKCWDEQETVDFFIDDGAEVTAGYCCPPLNMEYGLRKSNNISDGLCNKDSVVAECDEDTIWNDLLFAYGDLVETLV